MMRLTPAVKNIIIICVGVYILQRIVGGLSEYLMLYRFGTPDFRPYQLFSYMFAHDPRGIGHIFFNMLTFAFMAPQIEEVWGFKRFLKYFLLTGIGAGVIYLGLEYLIDPYGTAPMLGASGALYGVLMAYAFLYPDMDIRLMFPPVSIKGKYLAIVLGVFGWISDPSGQVAHFAHLGGAVAGFLILRFGLLND
jgi:membrane associated rhomboid family serine protease